MTRIQFILKNRDNKYDCDDYSYNTGRMSSGLFNSARFVQEMLHDRLGYETTICFAIDNNCIDRLVTEYKPDIVIIEAYWVVPDKFAVLTKLHPNITWVVRNHSSMPFASTEGIIVDWSLRYMDYPNVILACNDKRTDREFKHLIGEQDRKRCVLLPNYYPLHHHPREKPPSYRNIDIGCFGAIRPLKNQLIQAVAAIEYANQIGKHLRFHINGTRIEGRGDAILRNIRGLFQHVDHELIEHNWLTHEEFIKVIRDMDVSMQVSYSESFNIVSADAVMNGVPVVVSSEISWVNPIFHADPNDSDSIVHRLDLAMRAAQDRGGLYAYDEESVERWKVFVDHAAANRS